MAKKRAPRALPPRLFKVAEAYYWKPERRLRPRWKSAALGADPRLASAEARRLNAAADAWLAAQAEGAPAVKSRVRLGPATVSQLVNAYKVSEDWRLLRASTVQTYLYEFRRLEAAFGHDVAATLSLRQVDDWLETLRRRSPATARGVLAKGRLLFAWAQRKEMIPNVNPFKGQRRIRRGKSDLAQGGKRSARFTWEELQIVVEAADRAGLASIGDALTLAFACVQRISDVLRIEAQHVAGGRLRFVQSKTGFAVDMALPPIAAERLACRPRAAAGPLVVSETTGGAYHEKTVSRVFARLRDSLVAEGHTSIAGKQLRDGRRSGFVQYVLDGASIPFVCSMSGHSIEEGMAIVEHYLPKTADQADRAVAMLSVRWR